MINEIILVVGAIVALVIVLSAIVIVRPVEKVLIERFGKYNRTLEQGLNFKIPILESAIAVNITERMVDVEPQTVITNDKLNTVVDAIVYSKIKDVKASQYNVDDHRSQLVSLARTTLRAVIGKMTLAEANEERARINEQIEKVLDKETDSYGVEVLRVELQRIDPPEDVQVSMNEVVKAEQEKIAAVNLATAVETKADGTRRAIIKEAEGSRQAAILRAEGEARAITQVADAKAKKYKVESESLKKYFTGPAQTYEKLVTVKKAMEKGSKYLIPQGTDLTTVISEVAGIVPVKKKPKE